VQIINDIIYQVHDKINEYKKSYQKKIVSLSLHDEINHLKKQVKLLDNRLHFLFELLKIYLPLQNK
jgi:hypothetical protein